MCLGCTVDQWTRPDHRPSKHPKISTRVSVDLANVVALSCIGNDTWLKFKIGPHAIKRLVHIPTILIIFLIDALLFLVKHAVFCGLFDYSKARLIWRSIKMPGMNVLMRAIGNDHTS